MAFGFFAIGHRTTESYTAYGSFSHAGMLELLLEKHQRMTFVRTKGKFFLSSYRLSF